jgi:aspartyl protease family protein
MMRFTKEVSSPVDERSGKTRNEKISRLRLLLSISLQEGAIQNRSAECGKPVLREIVKPTLILVVLLVPTVGAVVASKNLSRGARADTAVSDFRREREPTTIVQIPRGMNGEFSVQARINGIAASMVVDTGATSIVLTYETAKAAGFPLELLDYNIDVQTAGGRTKAARLWLDRIVIGKLVERSVPALVVPRGLMKTNLLGMSFLDRLESFEVRADQLMLHGFQEPPVLHISRRSMVLR